MSAQERHPWRGLYVIGQYLGIGVMFQWWDQFQAAEGWASVGWAASTLGVWLVVRGLVIKETASSQSAEEA